MIETEAGKNGDNQIEWTKRASNVLLFQSVCNHECYIVRCYLPNIITNIIETIPKFCFRKPRENSGNSFGGTTS